MNRITSQNFDPFSSTLYVVSVDPFTVFLQNQLIASPVVPELKQPADPLAVSPQNHNPLFPLSQSENEEKSHQEAGEVQLAPRPQSKTKTPPLFKVILLNDDFTPMEFVVDILTKIFRHDSSSANHIMMQVHQKGSGVAGVFTHEVAETKVHLTYINAQKQKYPLKCIMEEA